MRFAWKSIGLLALGAFPSLSGSVFIQTPLGDAFEKDGKYRVVIVRNEPTETAITLEYHVLFRGATAHEDIENPRGVVRFEPGQTNQAVVLNLVRDGLVEPAERCQFFLTNAVGFQLSGTPTAHFYILDEQTPAGLDPAFPEIKEVIGVAQLQDNSLIVLQRTPSHDYTRIRRVTESGIDLFSWEGLLKTELKAAHLFDDGSVLLGGRFSVPRELDFPLLRLASSGQPVADFPRHNGKFIGIQRSGKAILNIDQRIIRIGLDGSVDDSFTPLPFGVNPCLLSDDSILLDVNDPNGYLLRRFSNDGLADTNFPSMRFANLGPALPMPDGGFVRAGWWVSGAAAPTGISRFRADGSVLWNCPYQGAPFSQHHDKIYLTGVTLPDLVTRGNIVRLDAAGEIDFTFLPDHATPLFGAGPHLYCVRIASSYPEFFTFFRMFATNALRTDISFSEADIFLPENQPGSLKLIRTGDTSRGSTLDLAFPAGPQGKVQLPPQATFAPLESELLLPAGIQDNSLPEADLALTLDLANLRGASPGRFPRAQLHVVDDDGRPGNLLAGGERWNLPWRGPVLHDLVQLRDGRILLAGQPGFWLPDDQRLHSFNPQGVRESIRYPLEPVYALGEQSDGRILLAGELRSVSGCLARINPDGTPDSTFRAGWGHYGCHGIYIIEVQPDDKIVLGGLLSDYSSSGGILSIVRVLPSGAADPSFVVAPNSFYNVQKILLQPDGKILLLFKSSSLGAGVTGARLNPNGSLDRTFEPIRLARDVVFFPALALQKDGKVLVSQHESSPARTHFVRYTPNGLPDPSFNLAAPPNGPVTAIVLQEDGKILVGGLFENIAGVRRPGLARLNSDGSVDRAFDPGTAAPFSHVVFLAGGDILVGGSFTHFNGLPANGLALLKSSIPFRAILPRVQANSFSVLVTGNPGQRILLESSSDLVQWQPGQTQTLENYTAGFSMPVAGPAELFRALLAPE